MCSPGCILFYCDVTSKSVPLAAFCSIVPSQLEAFYWMSAIQRPCDDWTELTTQDNLMTNEPTTWFKEAPKKTNILPQFQVAIKLNYHCRNLTHRWMILIVLLKQHVFSAGHQGRLSGETRGVCEGKKCEGVTLFSVVLLWYEVRFKSHPLLNIFAELETEVVHTQQTWTQVLQRQRGESFLILSELHFLIWVWGLQTNNKMVWASSVCL